MSNPGGVERQEDGQLVAAAVAGTSIAWDELVLRYAQLVWDVARSGSLDTVSAADVCVLTWARCADHLDELASTSVRDWLVAAARAEAVRAAMTAQGRMSTRALRTASPKR